MKVNGCIPAYMPTKKHTPRSSEQHVCMTANNNKTLAWVHTGVVGENESYK